MDQAQELVLKAELRPTEEMTVALRAAPGIVDVAKACEIDSPEMAAFANDEMRDLKRRLKRVEELHKSFVAPAKQMIENANALFKPTMVALAEAESVYKGKLLTWTQEQERIAAEKRRAAEAEARRQREEAAAKAASERARAEEEAREKRRQAEVAEAERQRALEAGRAEEAAAAAAQAAQLRVEARAVVSDAEARAVDAQMEADLSVPIPLAPAKPEGLSVRKNWQAELADGVDETRAVVMIAQAIASGRADLVGLLKRDTSACNRLAKALEENMNVPGLIARNRPVAASRA